MTYYRLGDFVTDATRALTGQVHAVHGKTLTLVRPSGFLWEADADQCWKASAQERAGLTPGGTVRVISTARRRSS
ncbi:hypothetical protein [Streptomyces sp. CC208A]|uniref:hypothetical protein n=1 Tax=Streptomyces sp. CC208A TaxID=3044573 RepID=UPI0024A86036|nr:hypothetical protein [Streptomyces sp. CC208A]